MGDPTGRTIYGRGEISVGDVQSVGLAVEPTENPPRHADIVGWPEEKPERKAAALELENHTALKLREEDD